MAYKRKTKEVGKSYAAWAHKNYPKSIGKSVRKTRSDKGKKRK